jgi:serine/threonine-protein kinase HipA
MIDFLQILELADKYKGTMETLGKTIGDLSVNTLFDKLRFFESTVFNYIIGNNDMHLKNYSMFLSEMGWVLAPFYDLLNVKLILPKDKEDTALLLGGKKENFSKGYFDRLGIVLKLNDKQMNAVYKRLQKWLPEAIELIDNSFLDPDRQKAYKEMIAERVKLFTTDGTERSDI